VSWITFSHHVHWLEDSVGKLGNGELLVVGLLCGDDGSVRAKHEVDSWIRNQVGLELIDIDVERTSKSKRGGQRGDQLSNQSVEVSIGGFFDIQRSLADIVDSLIIKHEGNIGVLQERVGREHRVVGLNDGSRDLRRGVNTEIEFGFLSIIDGQSLQEEGSESRSSTSSNRVEDEESLESGALIGQLSDLIESGVDELLSYGIVTSSVVVCSVFLAGNQLIL